MWTLFSPSVHSEELLESGQLSGFTAFLSVSQNSKHKNLEKSHEREKSSFFHCESQRFSFGFFFRWTSNPGSSYFSDFFVLRF
jgi:hypothetical protein